MNARSTIRQKFDFRTTVIFNLTLDVYIEISQHL